MNTIDKMTKWGDKHHLGWFDFFRILLGAVLFYKGVEFASDPHEVKGYFEGGYLNLYSFFLVQAITLVHLAGGVMIAAGLVTRWAVIFQIPILVGAIFLNLQHNYSIYSNLNLSVIVLILLIIFLIYGSGPYSVDEFIKRNEGEPPARHD